MAQLKLVFWILFLTFGRMTISGETNAWQSLFNGKDLSGWDKWLGPKSSGYVDPKSGQTPLGLNNDPAGVFTVVEKDGAPAIRISGEIFGAITSTNDFGN